jgi:ribosomal protein S18 acetylase RimI-like enzyme
MWLRFLYEECRFSVYELRRVDSADAARGDERMSEFSIEPCGPVRVRDMAACKSPYRIDREAGVFTDRLLTGSMCFSLKAGNEIVGFGWANAGGSPPEDKDGYRMVLGKEGAYLWDFYVSSAYRGRGLDQFLVREVQKRLAAMGLFRCFVRTDGSDERNAQRYEGMGARLVETVRYRRRFGFGAYRIEAPTGSVVGVPSGRSNRAILRDFSETKTR